MSADVKTDRLPTEDEVREALKVVVDPEIGYSIIDLGLVYGIDVEDNRVVITMTLTSPGCPFGPIIRTQAHSILTQQFPAVEDVKVNLVWYPRWDPRTMCTEEIKAELGIW